MTTLSQIIGLSAVALCWIFSAVLFRVGTPGSVARRLAWLLVFEGITLVTNVLYHLVPTWLPPGAPEVDPLLTAVFVGHTFGDCAMLAFYPGFLAAALNTRLTRVFAGKGAQWLVFGIAAALFLAVLFTPINVGGTLLYVALTVLFTFAFVASIHGWLVAKPGGALERARTFAIAFGIRDICWGFVYATTILTALSGDIGSTERDFDPINFIYRLSTLVYVPILAYGILRSHLFDIDLRIRWTIKQSTVAAIFLAVMFVISEGASQFLSDELGTVTGLLAAGVLMFFLAPLQRFADRVASSAMPNTENTPEYKAFRKMQVYESAIAEALQVGGISDKERNLLGHLRESLGISETDAAAIEQALTAGDAAPGR